MADKTIFNFFDGLESYRRERYQAQGADKTIQLIKGLPPQRRFPTPPFLVDEDGIGGVVVDQLTGIKGFMGGQRRYRPGRYSRQRI